MSNSSAKTRTTLKTKAKALPAIWGLSSELKLQLKIVPQSALSDFVAGRPVDEWHWNALAFRVHVGASLSDLAVPDTSQHFAQAIAVLDASRQARATTGEWKFTQADLVIVGDALNLTDTLQDVTTRSEQRDRGKALIKANINDIGRVGLQSMESALRWIK